VLGADADVRPSEAHQLIAEAIDLLVQIGIRDEIRRVTAVANVGKELLNGEIFFDPVYIFDDHSPAGSPQWNKVGELRPRIVAETSF
jgi:pilus assembly protein CpaF